MIIWNFLFNFRQTVAGRWEFLFLMYNISPEGERGSIEVRSAIQLDLGIRRVRR